MAQLHCIHSLSRLVAPVLLVTQRRSPPQIPRTHFDTRAAAFPQQKSRAAVHRPFIKSRYRSPQFNPEEPHAHRSHRSGPETNRVQTAVEAWIVAIRHEEELASVEHTIADLDAWEQASLKEADARTRAKEAKQRYKDALRHHFFNF
jgi:hypothetical protein